MRSRLSSGRFGARVLAFAIVQLYFCPVRLALAGELLDIYHQAKIYDPQMKIEEHAYESAKESKNAGKAALLPSLNVVSGYSREMRTLDYGTGSPAQSSDSVDLHASLVLAQPILDFPAWYNYFRLSKVAEQGRTQFDSAQQDLIIRVSQAYLSVLKSRSHSELYRQEEAAYESFLDFVRSRLKAGVASIIDLHEAEAAYNSSKINTINALNVESSHQIELEMLLGHRHPVLYTLSHEYPYQALPVHEERASFDTARQNNLALSAQKLQSESLFYGAKSLRAEHYPKIGLKLSHGVTSQMVKGDQGGSLDKIGSVISVNVTIPIFAGGGATARARKANFEYLQSLEMEELLLRKIKASIAGALASIESTQASLRVYAISIDSNGAGLANTIASYKLGVKELSDVLMSQRLLYQSRRDQRSALFSLVFDVLLLKQTRGDLSESDLTIIDQWLVHDHAEG